MFADYFAFGFRDVHHLDEALFVYAVEEVADGERRGTELAFQPELPLALAGGGIAAGQNTVIAECEYLAVVDHRAGGSGAQLAGTPELFGHFIASAELEGRNAARTHK